MTSPLGWSRSRWRALGIGAVPALHELPIDDTGGIELLGRAPELVCGLEQLLLEFGDALSQPLVGGVCKGAGREQIVRNQSGAFNLGETVLEGPQLLLEAPVLGAAVLQVCS